MYRPKGKVTNERKSQGDLQAKDFLGCSCEIDEWDEGLTLNDNDE